MAVHAFKPVLKPTAARMVSATDFVTFFAKDSFRLSTLLLMGALVQIAVFTLIPSYRLAILPAALLTIKAVVTTIRQTASGPASADNTFMDGVVRARVTAQLPDAETGSHGSDPAAREVVVLHLGVRFNHPLGLLAPGCREVSDHFQACNGDIERRADEYGLLGLSTWRGSDRASNNTLMLIYYFKDLAAVNKFAHDPIHRAAWDWYPKAGHKHISIFHELFLAPAKSYESIYVNCQPTLLGASSVKSVVNAEGDEAWVSPLVDADHAALRTQFGRLGRVAGKEAATA